MVSVFLYVMLGRGPALSCGMWVFSFPCKNGILLKHGMSHCCSCRDMQLISVCISVLYPYLLVNFPINFNLSVESFRLSDCNEKICKY